MIGKTISHYKILEKLGEGGMGEVYRAQDLRLKREVALKFLSRRFLIDEKARDRFEREAQTAASLNHPNIITIYGIGEFKDQTYIAMELVEGQSLDQMLQRGLLPIPQATEFMIAISDALSVAHRKNIIHRDIKPGNIMVTSQTSHYGGENIKLLDFGLARIKQLDKNTLTGTIEGTLAYMSPEQAQGEAVDHRTDIFSLGVVAYEMLTGTAPFTGDYQAAVLYTLLNEDPVPMSERRPGIPRDLELIVFKAMAKNPQERYQSLQDVLADLAAYQYKPQTLVSKTAPEKTSIAVLPFEDISPGKQNEFLADGMSEELIMTLSKVKQLRVIAKTSVMQYKGKAKDVRDIGREMGVTHVIEGSVRRFKQQLRITAQLVDATDGSHLWADKYDGIMKDIFKFQEEVANQVTGALSIELDQAEKRGLVKKQPHTKAYEYYLQGKMLLDTPTIENLDRAELLLKRALKLDPQYASALGSLAICYYWNVGTGLRPDPNYLIKAEEAAQQALLIDRDQADAQFMLANLDMMKGHIEKAYQGFGKVIDIDKNHSNSHLFKGILLYYSSYFEEALTEADWLLSVDPFWPMAHWLRSTIRLHQGIFEVALAEYQQVVTEIPSKLVWLALSFRYVDKMEQAWEAAKAARKFDPDGVLWQMAFAFLEGAEGRGDKILKYIDERVKTYSWDFIITVYWVASIYALAGKKDEAIRWLHRGIELGNRNHLWFTIDPNLKTLRTDPRFSEIIEQARNSAGKLKVYF
ncbi:MAG: protein kinase [Calditrichaeota bacterium]|nr:protein kinase [Calditrichota bacterium]